MKIKNLYFKFNESEPSFFKDLSIDFAPRHLNFIQGKNGVGKSTLFNILLGKVEAQSQIQGTIELNEKSYEIKNNRVSSQLTTQIKLVQQQFDRMLADNFTFQENLQLANLPTYPGLKSLPNIENLPAIIKSLNIPTQTPVKLLSGGQRQILAICMALQKPTSILLLDEPTAALDEKNARMVMAFLQELVDQLQLTILIISHDRELVLAYAKHNYFQMNESNVSDRNIEKITI